MIDISNEVHVDDIPLCPMCDQPIWSYEDDAIGECRGVKCLVHADCAEEES